MAHELTATDGLVLHRQSAWHNLGTIIENAPTPAEALKIAKLDWQVEQWPISATDGESRVALGEHFANIRSDTRQCLGVTGKGYKPYQNAALADFCASLADQGDTVKIETAGSIRGGAKVWFLLRGESFSVRGGDQLAPYILVSNGHDGGTALRCTPTTVRVVCSNTLHMVIPQRDGRGKIKTAGYVTRHTGSLKAKLAAARAALSLYDHALSETRSVIDQLTAKNVDSDAVRRFFLESYARDFGAIADVPVTKQERAARDRAMKAARAYDRRFERESGQFGGASMWLAVNAYTGWLQNDRHIRIKDATARREQRLSLSLFGDDAERTTATLQAALSV
jgi:phage/plasmid-like protein (TIGR03299 family)